ncbi:cell division protein FtsX [Bacteroidota bacterium]
MKKKPRKLKIYKLKSSYLTTIVSISLVLFLLSLLSLLILNTKKLSDYVKENIGYSLILKENTKEADIFGFQKTLNAASYIKSTEYISPEQAADELKAEIGEDFIEFLGYNPLLASIDVFLIAEYANPDSLIVIENRFLSNSIVKEVFYQKNLLHLVNENAKKIGLIILIFSIFLFFISIALINNTIRLSVYAKRFIINAMQLVGATYGFIRRPFLIRSVLNGILGGGLAFVLLSGIILIAQKEIHEIISFKDYELLAVLLVIIIILGIFISLFSTLFAVNKYLRMKSDHLFY